MAPNMFLFCFFKVKRVVSVFLIQTADTEATLVLGSMCNLCAVTSPTCIHIDVFVANQCLSI